MEFTVSKADLVRELNLSQGVVEKKTTIPDPVERSAGSGRRATDADGHGSGVGDPLLCPGQGEEERSRDDPGEEAAGLCPAAAGRRRDSEVQREPLGEHLTCGRSKTRIAGMSRESFPELPEMPERGGDCRSALLAAMIAQDDLCDLGGRVAVHAEWRAAGAEPRRRSRWWPPTVTGWRWWNAENPLDEHGGVQGAAARARRWRRLLKLAADAEDQTATVRFLPATTITCSSSWATGC